jgi:hypothetical protein
MKAPTSAPRQTETSPMEKFKSLTSRLLTVSNKQLKDEIERERLAKPDQRNKQR